MDILEFLRPLFYYTGLVLVLACGFFVVSYFLYKILGASLKRLKLYRPLMEYIFFRKKILQWISENKNRMPDSEDLKEHGKY